jgi:hypothetical protein
MDGLDSLALLVIMTPFTCDIQSKAQPVELCKQVGFLAMKAGTGSAETHLG